MNNRRQPESYADTGFSSSSNFCEPKLDFPRFNGDDSTGWIYREEQYFSIHITFYVNKIPLASFHLEQEAIQWFCWHIKAHEEPNWIDFFQLLLQWFGPSAFDEFTGALTKLELWGRIRQNLRNWPIKHKDFLMLSIGFVLSVVEGCNLIWG